MDSGILRIAPGTAAVPGTEVPVGTVLAYLVEPGEAAPFAQAPAEPALLSADQPPRPIALDVPVADAAANGYRAPAASPRARRVAPELGVDWTALSGSGAQAASWSATCAPWPPRRWRPARGSPPWPGARRQQAAWTWMSWPRSCPASGSRAPTSSGRWPGPCRASRSRRGGCPRRGRSAAADQPSAPGHRGPDGPERAQRGAGHPDHRGGRHGVGGAARADQAGSGRAPKAGALLHRPAGAAGGAGAAGASLAEQLPRGEAIVRA